MVTFTWHASNYTRYINSTRGMSLCQKVLPPTPPLFLDLRWPSWLIISLFGLPYIFTITEETLKRNQSSYEQVEYQRTHTKDEKIMGFLDAKWLPKSGTLQHDQLISLVPMLNMHHHIQFACNLKTVKNKLPFWYHWHCLYVFVSEKIHIEKAMDMGHPLCL